MRRNLIGLAGLVLVAAVYLVFGGQPVPIDPATDTARRLRPGPFTPHWEEFDFVDSSRPTDPSGEFAGSAERLLPVRLWRPAGLTGSGPLVLYSHGFMSNRKGGTHLAEYLASHGWLVAALEFPLTSYPSPGRPTPLDAVNQPADLSFVLGQLLRRNADPADPLYQSIDPLRVAAVGYSLGGFTTQMLAFHPQMADARIAVAVSIAGPTAMLSADFFSGRRLPFMMVAATADALVDYQRNAVDITGRVPGAILVSLEAGSHAGFNYMAQFLRHLRNPDQLTCWLQSENYSENGDSLWYQRLGGPEQGILGRVDMSVCSQKPLPTAMNPLRQQELTLLAVRSFLDCRLEPGAELRRQQCLYLLETLPAEVSAVSVINGSAMPPGAGG